MEEDPEAIGELNKDLFPLSELLILKRPNLFIQSECHEDDEGFDLLWLTKIEDEYSLGHLILVSRKSLDIWTIAHEYADKFGGWPTVWTATGSQNEVMDKFIVNMANWKPPEKPTNT